VGGSDGNAPAMAALSLWEGVVVWVMRQGGDVNLLPV
jgi:hypothetical protein